MKYVLLLRGINVGGRNKVSMADLKDAITGLGYENVITYINTGNIIFNSIENIGVVNDKISQILNSYPFKINKVILTKQEYIEELKNLPSWWNNDFYRKDVLFYSEDIDFSSIKERINNMPLNEENVYFGKRAIFWGKFNEKNYLKTAYHKYLIKESFYKAVTIRNGRTFMKIAELLDKEH
ncbi:phosphopentomutase [Streptococcus sp. UMB1385]|nr:phosphopentomutase [Streptococcus sp. UMB1385]